MGAFRIIPVDVLPLVACVSAGVVQKGVTIFGCVVEIPVVHQYVVTPAMR